MEYLRSSILNFRRLEVSASAADLDLECLNTVRHVVTCYFVPCL